MTHIFVYVSPFPHIFPSIIDVALMHETDNIYSTWKKSTLVVHIYNLPDPLLTNIKFKFVWDFFFCDISTSPQT